MFREERNSYKLDRVLNGIYQIELVSFPDPPGSPSYPGAAGLRHLAFEVNHLQESTTHLSDRGVSVEEIRTDPTTNKAFTFFADPDGLLIELYEK